MQAYYNRFSLTITKKQAVQGSHQGPCDDDINYLLTLPVIKRQFNKIHPDDIRKELTEYGAWNEEELSNDGDNRARMLWIACGDIREEYHLRD